DIFSYFCNNNYPFFQELVTQLCHAASNYHLETIKPYLEHIFYLCLMNDGLPHKRVQFAVQEVLKLSKTYNNFPNCCECFHFIEAICESHVGPIAQRFLELYLSEWVPTFLLYNMYDVVRQKAESLCDIVIFKKLDEVRDEQDMQEAEESVKKLYCLLLDMMESAEA
ncbi:4417_t:CDS:2, partial [Paraglomus occultum]